MTLTIPDDVRAKAEIYVGDAAGQEKTRFLLQETGLPSGLLPLRDIVECGYVEETGFVWLKQRRKVDHYFAKAGRHVSYGAEVSAVAEKGRLKKITGVKAKEMLVWVSLHEICLDEGAKGGDKLVCKAIGGLSRSFPVEAFEAPDAGVQPVKPPVVDAAAAAVESQEAAAKKLQEEAAVKKPDEESDGKEAKKSKEEAEDVEQGKKSNEDGAAAAVDKVQEKLKEMSTADPAAAVQTEAVAAKN